jgi:hypothetical protein
MADLWQRLRAIRLALLALESYAVGRVPFDTALSRTIDLLTVEYEATMLLLADTPRESPARPRRRRRRGARMPTLVELPDRFYEMDLAPMEHWFVFWEWMAWQTTEAKCGATVAGYAAGAASELPVHRMLALREQLRAAAA